MKQTSAGLWRPFSEDNLLLLMSIAEMLMISLHCIMQQSTGSYQKCERTFDAMVKTEAGIRLVKQTLLNPTQAQPQHAGRWSTVGLEHLEVRI